VCYRERTRTDATPDTIAACLLLPGNKLTSHDA
jgi:hypothetical protein